MQEEPLHRESAAGVLRIGHPRAPQEEEELEVMRLIVTGLTDYAIARRLRIAVITVRRRATRFRLRVGAFTRIEAAVIAAKRGLL